MSARKLRVALIAGGRSSEHDISLASARSVLESLDPERYEVVNVAIARDGRWEISDRVAQHKPALGAAASLPVPAGEGALTALGSVDVALPILHGPFGEDGTVQGVLELAGIEIEVGVLGNLPSPRASLPGKVVSNYADWYDWSSKYDDGGSDLLIPPPGVSDEQVMRAQELAVRAFVATECEGMARADFFVREADGEVVMNELNTIPGFTATSFYSRLFAASGIPYDELLTRLIDLALERHERRSGLEF